MTAFYKKRILRLLLLCFTLPLPLAPTGALRAEESLHAQLRTLYTPVKPALQPVPSTVQANPVPKITAPGFQSVTTSPLTLLGDWWKSITTSQPKVSIKTFKSPGAQTDWSADGKKIAYSLRDRNNHDRIYVSDPDGRNAKCMTCNHPSFPGHTGAADFHPSGKYLLFVAEKKNHSGGSYAAIPGFGGYSDIWVMTADGKQAFQLTDLPSDYDHGVLIPRFSPDGKKIVWSQRVKQPNFFDSNGLGGLWEIKVADFVEGPGGPQLKNIKTFTPGGESFYETYGFSPDGKKIIFCSNMTRGSFWEQQIYTIDAETGGNLKQLTSDNYNEHAAYTPDGKSIVWMSSRFSTAGGTDWWIMNADGTNKSRLTYFNEFWHPDYAGKAVWAGLVSFSPDGKKFVGDIQQNLITQEARAVIVEFKP